MPAHLSKHITLPAAAVAALAAIRGAASQPRSVVFCRTTAITKDLAVSQDAYTSAWLDIGNYVCGSQADEPTIINIEEQSEAVAFAIAEAFAEASTSCHARGNAFGRSDAYARVQNRAEAIGEAISEIFASAEVCGKCTAAVSAISETSQVLVAEALAEAWTDIYLYSDGGVAEDGSTVTSHVVVETIATVLSSISAVIRAGADDGCSIEVINSAQIGDFLAQCELAVSGDDRVVEVDAIAKAGADASAYACNGDIAEAETETIAIATAHALAEAVAQADVYCMTNGGDDTMACGLAEFDVRAVASAQADAFATAFASAATCNCDVSVGAAAHVWDEIWVEAVVNAYAETCSVGNGEEFVTDFQFAVEERMLTSTARAIASAVAFADEEDGSECRVSANVCSNNSPQCVRNNQKCGGSGFDDVLPCCDPNYRCFRRTATDFRCRHRNARLPSFWDGTIEACTLGLSA